MERQASDWQNGIIDHLESIRQLLAPEIWENILLDCSKNEVFVLLDLLRQGEVTMSELAGYLQVPLNTVTGIITRMEKKQLVERRRSPSDKRVVTVTLTTLGKQQIDQIMAQLADYAQLILGELTAQERAVLLKLFKRLPMILRQTPTKAEVPQTAGVKKIIVE